MYRLGTEDEIPCSSTGHILEKPFLAPEMLDHVHRDNSLKPATGTVETNRTVKIGLSELDQLYFIRAGCILRNVFE